MCLVTRDGSLQAAMQASVLSKCDFTAAGWRFGLWLPLYSCQSVPTGRALQSSQELATSRGTMHLADAHCVGGR